MSRLRKRVSSPLRAMALAGVLAGVLLSGCAVGPRFAAPQPDTHRAWSSDATASERVAALSSRPDVTRAPAGDWWRQFNDEALNALIDRAVVSNVDLRTALIRVDESRASRDIAAADRWPSIGFNASATRSRVSETTATGAILAGGHAALPGVANPFNQFQYGFDASWEVDLFGRVRRSVEASNAEVAASIEDRNDVLLTLLGDVARTYIELRGEQLRLAVTSENLRTQRDVLALTRMRAETGTGNSLDVANAAAQVASTDALLPELERQISESINQLSLLLGADPGALRTELTVTAAVPAPPLAVPIGVAADLARRRPDIRRAEAKLHAAVALVGVAEADLFPRLTLGATADFQAAHAGDLAKWASRFASIGPSLELPILDGGRRRATLRLQSLREREAMTAYERTVLGALHEVSNALTAFGTEQSRYQSLAQAVVESRDALALSKLRYASGLTAFLDVLDAERSEQQAELAEAQSKTQVSTTLVALFKSLGGGWQEVAPL